MSIGARPLSGPQVRAIFERKMSDFRHVAGTLRVWHLRLEPYFEAARRDDDVRFALDTGYMTSVEEELRDPVLADMDGRVLYTCPPLAVRVLASEPPEIHRAFVEGAFFRKLFRFFVPAAHEGAPTWAAVEQVREIMRRHFALQLVVTETLLEPAS